MEKKGACRVHSATAITSRRTRGGHAIRGHQEDKRGQRTIGGHRVTRGHRGHRVRERGQRTAGGQHPDTRLAFPSLLAKEGHWSFMDPHLLSLTSSPGRTEILPHFDGLRVNPVWEKNYMSISYTCWITNYWLYIQYFLLKSREEMELAHLEDPLSDQHHQFLTRLISIRTAPWRELLVFRKARTPSCPLSSSACQRVPKIAVHQNQTARRSCKCVK